MNSEQILFEVTEIFKNVLDNSDIKLIRETSSTDIEEWDSLNHIQLVIGIEKHFKLRFTTSEIQNWSNVGEMCDAIQKRLAI